MAEQPGAPATPVDARAIPLDRAQRILSAIWFVFSGLIVALLIVQTLLHAYDFEGVSVVAQVWNWALPQFVPTLSLMIGVFAATALAPPVADPPRVNRGFLLLAASLSAIYLALVMGTIFAEALWRDAGPIKLMETANLWLAPFQGLVASALGALFVSTKR